MALKKCVYVVATPGWQQAMCDITLPNLKAYADRIGADFCLISERKFPDYPPEYEKHQIYELGKDYDWNISIDADMLVRPDIDDFTEWHPPEHVGNWWFYDLRAVIHAEEDPYFARDGRFYGIVECLVATSKLTHDLWEPLPGKFEDYFGVFKDGYTRRISEYNLSRNLAKYGLKVSGILRDGANFFHINNTTDSIHSPADVAVAKLKEWGVR
jgi:hypothetical protein